MTHEEARELLLDLSYGELAPGLQSQVEQHVSKCTECESELAALAGVRAVARRLPDPGLPGGREEVVEVARRAAASHSPVGRRSWARPAAWMAAAAMVLAVGGVTFRLLEGGPLRESGPDRVVASAPAGRTEKAEAAPGSKPPPAPPPSEAPPATPAPRDALASREPPDSLERAAKRSRQEAPAPAAGATAERAQAVGAGRVREDAVQADFPPGASGAFVSIDLRSRTPYRLNAAGCATRHAPYSTFEIPASLIGLETGVIADLDERWRWDAERNPPPSPAREVATRVGEPRMKQWLASFDYGNRDLSGGLDRFWLGNSLRISPDEQAAFLARLQRGELPVSKANLDRVTELLAQESGPGFRLVVKTGSAPDGQGWLVGWVETPGGGCAFALHLEAPSHEEMARIRPELARGFLRRAGCIPR